MFYLHAFRHFSTHRVLLIYGRVINRIALINRSALSTMRSTRIALIDKLERFLSGFCEEKQHGPARWTKAARLNMAAIKFWKIGLCSELNWHFHSECSGETLLNLVYKLSISKFLSLWKEKCSSSHDLDQFGKRILIEESDFLKTINTNTK